MNKKLIIFDKDGTLLDFDAFWLPVSEAAISEILLRAQIDASVSKEIFKAFDVKDGVTAITSELCHGTYASMGRVIYSVLQNHNVKLSEDEIISLTREAYHKHMNFGEFKPTSENLYASLKELRESGITLGVVTTDAPLVTEECLKQLGIRELFDFVLTDDGVIPPKPSPVSLELVREKLCISKDEVLMVGDTLTDVSYARAAGVKVVGLAKNAHNADILKAGGASAVISDISKLSEVLHTL